MGQWLDIERLIHSTKTAIACIVGFLLAKLIGLKTDQWIIITIIVVMCAQIYVGSVVQRAYWRFIGTLAGCLLATSAILLLGTSPLVVGGTIGVAGFIFSYLATGRESLAYVGTLGAVTTTIILIGQTPTVLFAVERFLEISIGILIATLISQLVLPIHAGAHLRRAQGAALEKLRDFYSACLIHYITDHAALEKVDFDEEIVKSLSKQRQLAKEAAREPLGPFYDQLELIQTLYYEKELLRSIDFMRNALIRIKHGGSTFAKSDAFQAFNQTTVAALDSIIRVAHGADANKEHIHTPDINKLQETLRQTMEPSSGDEMIYIDGFLFSAERMSDCLLKLAKIYRIPAFEPTHT
jgi:uncharacterized membrane protein YccC